MKLIRTLLAASILSLPALPCSAFLVVGGGNVFFANNEDYWTPDTRIWFEPAAEGKHGIMYLGYSNGFPQGGMNDAGLAFDGFATKAKPLLEQEGKVSLKANPISAVMETCATVDEVVAFLEKVDLRPLMTSAMLMFADANGDSVIIEGDRFIRKSGDYQLTTNFYQSEQEDPSGQCPRFDAANRVLKTRKVTTLGSCAEALSAAAQTKGKVATLYSNVFDLKKRTVTLWLFHDFDTPVVLNLEEELAKGERTLKLPELFPQNAAYKAFVASQKFSKEEMQLIAALKESRSRVPAMTELRRMPIRRAMEVAIWALDREFDSVTDRMFRGELTQLLFEVSLEKGNAKGEPKIQDPRVLQILLDGLLEDDKDISINGLCLLTLKKVSAEHIDSSIPSVIRLLDDKDALLVAAAFQFLQKQGEKANSALPKALEVLNATQPTQVARWKSEREKHKGKRTWRSAKERQVRTRAGALRVALLGLAADIPGAESLDWRGKSVLANVYQGAFLFESQKPLADQHASKSEIKASLQFVTQLILDDSLPGFVNEEAFRALCAAFNLSNSQSILHHSSASCLETISSGASGELAKHAAALLSASK